MASRLYDGKSIWPFTAHVTVEPKRNKRTPHPNPIRTTQETDPSGPLPFRKGRGRILSADGAGKCARAFGIKPFNLALPTYLWRVVIVLRKTKIIATLGPATESPAMI